MNFSSINTFQGPKLSYDIVKTIDVPPNNVSVIENNYDCCLTRYQPQPSRILTTMKGDRSLFLARGIVKKQNVTKR